MMDMMHESWMIQPSVCLLCMMHEVIDARMIRVFYLALSLVCLLYCVAGASGKGAHQKHACWKCGWVPDADHDLLRHNFIFTLPPSVIRMLEE